MERRILFAHVLAFICALIWGSTFIVTKELVQFLTPIQIMCFRLALASLIFWLIRPVWSFDKRVEPIIFLMSLFGCTLYFFLETTALTYSYSSNVSILVSTTAMMALFLAWVLKKEAVRPNHVIGFIMAFAGVVLVIMNGVMVLHMEPFGDIMALMAALSWAIYGLFLLKYSQKYDIIILTRKIVVYGMITFAILAIIEGKPLDIGALCTFTGIGGILFLGLLGSCFCTIVWVYCVKNLGVVTSNIYHYMMPIVTLILAASLLGENITIMAVAGIAITVTGMLISNLNMKEPSEDEASDV